MKLSALWVASGLLLLTAMPSQARKFETRYRLSANIEREVGYGGQYLEPVAKARLNLTTEPPYKSTPQYFQAQIGAASDDKFALVADASGGKSATYDTLYLDKNRDGKIALDEKLSPSPGALGRGQTYGPVRIEVNCAPEGEKQFCPQYFRFSLQEYSAPDEDEPSGPAKKQFRLSVVNLGYYVARVALGGKERLFAVADANGNGVYNDVFKTLEGRGDMILPDLEGSKEAQTMSEYAGRLMSRLILSGDRYFELNAAPDGSWLDIAPSSKPTGVLKTNITRDFTLLLSSPTTGMVRVNGKNGVATAPEGEYKLAGAFYDLKDSSGASWHFDAWGQGATSVVRVVPGQTQSIEFGGPYSPHVAVQKGGARTLQLTLNVKGSGGEEYSNITAGGQRPPVPQARIVDAQGKDVALLDFHYG